MKSGKRWIIGEPFMKEYFMEVDLEKEELRIYRVTELEIELPNPMETTEGWAVMIFLSMGSVVLYIFAFLIYQRYEELKKMEILEFLAQKKGKEPKAF
jgi:hypothetical protein